MKAGKVVYYIALPHTSYFDNRFRLQGERKIQ